MEPLLWGLLGWIVLPSWLAAGLADYRCHRRMSLATTSGVRESSMHALQTAEIAVPALALLFLEITTATLALMVAGAAAHSVTAWRDVRYASRTREVPPSEQYIHAFLIVLPLMALAIVALLHWPAVAAMLHGRGDWALRRRDPAFEAWRVAAVLSAAALFGVLPGAWELLHAIQASRSSARSATKSR